MHWITAEVTTFCIRSVPLSIIESPLNGILSDAVNITWAEQMSVSERIIIIFTSICETTNSYHNIRQYVCIHSSSCSDSRLFQWIPSCPQAVPYFKCFVENNTLITKTFSQLFGKWFYYYLIFNEFILCSLRSKYHLIDKMIRK